MSAKNDPNIATCPSCGALIDVSEEEPFSLVNCSGCGAQMRVRKEFAHFEIHGILGEGGQGVVFRALDTKLNRPVAIKVMRRQYSADPGFVKRFEAEAQITASLNHPNIVKVYSFGEHRGLLYLAMEMVDHGSLESLITQAKKVPEERALELGIQIASGLKAGLALGLIHRDIKPGNLLFANEQTAKIVDFGLAILVEKQHEEDGDVWATPYYVPPEKLDGRAEDFRSDMYSLAATLFHAIAGRPPFISETNSMAELKKIKSRPVNLHSFAPQVSSPTAYAIDKALSADPDERFKSYDEFIRNLEYAREQLRKKPAAKRGPRVVQMGSSAQGGSWVTFLTVALIVGAGLYVWVVRENKNPGTAGGGKSPPPAVGTEAAAEKAFDESRKLMVGGKFPEAAREFRLLHSTGRLPEPKNSWCAVHLGLSEFLAEQGAKGRTAFESLAERLAPTAIGLDAKLVTFLTRLAAIGADKEKASPAEMEKFDKASYEAIAFLIVGAKRWNAGEFAAAVAAFRQFQQTTPTGESAWVGEYRPIVAPFLDDYGVYREIADAVQKADSAPEAAEAALKRILEVRYKIRSASLREKLTALESSSSEKVAAAVATAKAAMTEKQAELEATEEKLLTNIKLQVKDLSENYRFEEAAAAIGAVEVKLPRSIEERNLLAKRIEWLVQFKRQLISDLNTGGCTLPLQRKTGQQILGGVVRAAEDKLEIRVQFGSLPIAWSDLSPLSVLQMAGFYMQPTLPPAVLADRQWRAGVFCLFTQLFTEGQALMDAASAQNEEYKIHRALFFGQPIPEAPKQPGTTGAEPATGLEQSKQSLNPTQPDMNSEIIKGIRKPPSP
ncbi:MAG: serine/threonine-protein kinase [Chthoniobacteraceae bacterium]